MDIVFDHLELILVLIGFTACLFLSVWGNLFSREPVRRYEVMLWFSFFLGLWLMDGTSPTEDARYWLGLGVLIFVIFAALFSDALLGLREWLGKHFTNFR